MPEGARREDRMAGTADVLRDQGRGVVGALLIGTPLLFTMETWWLGGRLPAWTILLFAAGGLLAIMASVRVGGFREKERTGPASLLDWARQFTELVLQSFLAGLVVLFLFGILEFGDPLVLVARLALLELVPLGFGAALANTILKDGGDGQHAPFPKDVAVFALGALFFTLPIAPTEEMPLMAAHAGWWRLCAVVVASLLVTYLTLYELGFRGERGRARRNRPVLHVGQTFLVYATGLAISALLLAGYGHFHGAPPAVWVQTTVVLGFAAAMGGATAQVVL